MGAYSGCYKLAVFMTLFVQAFRLGAEPFFFAYAKQKNAPQVYALILKYFVLCGAVLFLGVCVFLEPLKVLLIRNESYWIAMQIVPLILFANLFLGIYHNLSIWYKLTDRTSMGMYISLGGALATIGLNVWLIPTIGFMGRLGLRLSLMAPWQGYLMCWGADIIRFLIMGRLLLYLSVSVAMGWLYIQQIGNLWVGTLMLFVFLFLGLILEKNE